MDDFQTEIYNAGKICGSSDINKILEIGCRNLNLILKTEKFYSLSDMEEWHRGGAETYITLGTVNYIDKNGTLDKRRIIAKAYSGFSPFPEKKVEVWQTRANSLKKANITASKVYSAFKGVIFTQFIQWSIIDFINLNRNEQTLRYISKQLSELANKMDNLKIYPVMIFSDLRTDGKKIYITDFGEDLGDIPGKSISTEFCRNLLKQELIKHNLGEIFNF